MRFRRVLPGTRRGITIRHVAFVLVLSAASWTLYHTYLKASDTLSSHQEHVFFWAPETPEVWADRAIQVKSAFLHAYHGYERHAFPHDELQPVSNKSIDK